MKKLSVAVVALVALCLAPAAEGGLIRYTGNPDPTTVDAYLTEVGNQPWTFIGTAGCFSAVNDGGTLSWYEDTVTGQPATVNAYYEIAPTTADRDNGNNLGWTLKAVVRVPVAGQSPFLGGNALVRYGDGNTGWIMNFGSEADGDPIVALLAWNPPYTWPGLNYVLQGAGSGAYHTYELRYDPVAGSVDLFVDGIERISNFVGQGPGYAGPVVSWGDSTAGAGGKCHFNLVEWSCVPEPATIALLGLGTLGTLVLRKRR